MSDEADPKETPDKELGDPDDGVAAFAVTHLVEAEDTVTPVGEIYDVYEEYTDTHRYETRNRSQFTRSLKKVIDYDIMTKSKRVDGEPTRVYIGIDFSFR